MNERRQTALAGALLVFASGCIALPFAAPPTSVTVSAGPALGRVQPPAVGGAGEASSDEAPAGADPLHETVVHGRVAIRPLGIIENYQDRRFDFFMGYQFEHFPADHLPSLDKHGGFFGLSHFPWTHAAGEDWTARLGVNAMADVVATAHRGELGGGMTFSLGLEMLRYGTGAFAGLSEDGGIIGGAIGEYGLGLEVAAGVRGVGLARYWLLTGGIIVHLPAVAGVVVVPVWGGDDD